MSAEHNHPPRCCCRRAWFDEPAETCPGCPEHGLKARHETRLAHAEEREQGLLAKYQVQRLGDVGGKHEECWFFVLDIKHDPIARYALAAYAREAAQEGFTALSADLFRKLQEVSEL